VVWGTDVTLNRPANPGDDGKVALASSGDLTYGYIANAQVASGAAIAVSKLAPGTNGQVLKTVGGAVAWSSDNQLNAPSNPTDDGKVALASGGNLVYGLISDSQISNSAAIKITKIDVSTGTEGYVLKIVSGVPTWATDGGGTANLPTTPGDDNKVAFASGGNLAYADGVIMLNPGTSQNALSLAGVLLTSGGSAPASPAGSEATLYNNGGVPKWLNAAGAQDLLRGTQPVSSTDQNKVAIADASGWYVPSFISNASIAASAAIEVSKLDAGSDYTVLRSLLGNVGWSLIGNDNIAALAGIAVSKLAGGSSGQYLRTSGGLPTWTSTLDGSQLSSGSVSTSAIAPATANYVMMTNSAGTAVTWAQVANANIATNASIAVTKLAVGSTNSVLASNGSSNFWDTTPTVSTLTGTSALISQGYVEIQASTTPASAPSNGARLFVQGNGVLGAMFDDNTVWEFAVEAYN